MKESKVVEEGDNKLEDLKAGQEFIHPWIERVFEKEKSDGIGIGMDVVNPDGKRFVGLLLDYDLETYPRFIFAVYNAISKRESIIDTRYSIGWTINWKESFYKL